ncbi:MAG TPA: CPXCG motif-containing cysteine-rich protein [Woeseiaceae bacterium]|nr:CPXCG motif-containing cysteine-rich protein [Woeseiaceae bacterium]
MHRYLTEHSVSCPYCAEVISILADSSAGDGHYIEDCQVCCRPMQVTLTVLEDDTVAVEVDCAG